MMRFLGICLVLAVGTIAAVVLGGQYLMPIKPPSANADPGEPARPSRRITDRSDAPSASEPARKVTKVEIASQQRALQAVILPDGRVMPADRVDMPSDREGSLMLLATPVRPGEYVPPHKLIVRPVTFLGVAVNPGEKVTKDELIHDPAQPDKVFRRPRPTDTFAPGTTTIVSMPIQFRKLAEDDEVEEGQMVGIVRPDLAVAELESEQSKVQATEAEYKAAIAMTKEMERQYTVAYNLRNQRAGNLDEVNKTKVQFEKAKAEEVTKRISITVAQKKMGSAWTTLNLHVLRAPIGGTIRTLYKHAGEAVKTGDSVMLLQNNRRLRVEAQVEVQDALPLRERLLKAREYRDKATALAAKGGHDAEVKDLRARADGLMTIEVEASRPQPPVAVLRGHLQEVTCVAVSRGPRSRIISGSEEGTVRLWDRVPGEERWEERVRLILGNPVRALACTPRGARKNLLMAATADGRVRLFDLDDPRTPETALPKKHQGAVNAVAFSADGTLAATGGEDRSICIWNVPAQELLLRKAGAHQSAITSLAFTPAGQLVSAGRDRGLVVWKVAQGNGNDKVLAEVDRLPGRSGDVSTLGLDPTGEYTLFDEGRELRVVSLANRRIEGSLSNSGASGSFSTLALFSPDGKTVLTNGNAPGRLQLWRAPSAKTRAAELRQFLWTNGVVTCGTFDPSGDYAVTGTTDHKVLVWKMPSTAEAARPIRGELSYVEGFLDTSLKRVTVRATFDNSGGWVIPGSSASIVVPPAARK